MDAVKMLLDHGANREITDHLDMSPREIANRMRLHNVVRLLDTYSMMSPALTPNSHVTSPMDMHNGELVANGYSNGAKPKKKRGTKNGDARDARRGESKRKGKKRPNSDESLPPPMPSPPDSVESPLGYNRTPPPGGIYSLPVTKQNVIMPHDHYQLKEVGRHGQGPHVVDMHPNMNGRLYSSGNNPSPAKGSMGAEKIWQQNGMSMHVPDSQVLVQGNTSQQPMALIRQQGPSTQSLQQTMSPEACDSSPKPCTAVPSPALSTQYNMASSPNLPVTTSQATQYARANNMYAGSPHRGTVPQQMHSMYQNQRMNPNACISELPNGHPNSPENCMPEYIIRDELLNPAKQNMYLLSAAPKLSNGQHRDAMSDKTSFSNQHSHNGSTMDPSCTYAMAMTDHSTFPTPSPESPSKWSNPSPISASDWSGSEAISSPPVPTNQQQMNGQELLNGRGHTGGRLMNGIDLQGGACTGVTYI